MWANNIGFIVVVAFIGACFWRFDTHTIQIGRAFELTVNGTKYTLSQINTSGNATLQDLIVDLNDAIAADTTLKDIVQAGESDGLLALYATNGVDRLTMTFTASDAASELGFTNGQVSTGGTAQEIKMQKTDTADNTSIQDLVDDLNNAVASDGVLQVKATDAGKMQIYAVRRVAAIGISYAAGNPAAELGFDNRQVSTAVLTLKGLGASGILDIRFFVPDIVAEAGGGSISLTHRGHAHGGTRWRERYRRPGHRLARWQARGLE